MILGAEAITKTTYAAGSRNSSGEYVAGASTASTIYASVQPATDEDLQLLEEGLRTREAKRVYTQTALTCGSQHDATPPDTLTIDGSVFEVQRVDRERSILPHYRAIATRLQE